jgi:hypothetical protein
MAITTNETEGLIDSTTLGEWLGVPVSTLNQWAYRKVGPDYIKLGRHRRYDPATVRRWLNEQTHQTAS